MRSSCQLGMIGPLIRVSIIWIGSMDRLHFVLSTIVFSWRASTTISSDSPFKNNYWINEIVSRSE